MTGIQGVVVSVPERQRVWSYLPLINATERVDGDGVAVLIYLSVQVPLTVLFLDREVDGWNRLQF